MFNIEVSKNEIALIPLETNKKVFTEEEYKKLDALAAGEKGKEKRVTKKFVAKLKKAGV